MKTKKKENLFALIIILGTMSVLGQNEIKITGKFLLPTADGIKDYKAVMIVTPSVVSIECEEKIFQVFNVFDAPRFRKLEVWPGDFVKITINEHMKQILIYSTDKFYIKHRNLLFTLVEGVFQCPVTYHCLGFNYNPADLNETVEKHFTSLTQRSKAIIWGSD